MLPKFVSSQPQYSLLWREPERDIFPLCDANGISQIVWSPLAEGVLTGKYRPGERPPAGSRLADRNAGWSIGQYAEDDVLELVERLRPIAAERGITLAQLALAWVLREPNVASAIVGATRPEQITENVAASGIALDAAALAQIAGAALT
jgi:1-deoxyxylulose-5-phosphate synthase